MSARKPITVSSLVAGLAARLKAVSKKADEAEARSRSAHEYYNNLAQRIEKGDSATLDPFMARVRTRVREAKRIAKRAITFATTLEERLATTQRAVGELLNRRAEDDTPALNRRVMRSDYEADLAVRNAQIADLRTNMDALATGTDRLQGRVTVLEQLNKQRSDEVAVLLEKCSTLQDRIDTLEEIVAKPAPQTSVRDCTVNIYQAREE